MSLLFNDKNSYTTISLKTLSDLKIDDINRLIFCDLSKQKRVLNYLVQISTSEEEIINRQKLFNDFIRNRSFYYSFSALVDRLDKVESDYNQIVSGRLKIRSKQEIILSDAIVVLKDYTKCLNELMDINSSLVKLINNYKLHSNALLDLKRRIEKFSETVEFSKLQKINTMIYDSFHSYTFTVKLDEYLYPSSVDYIYSTGKFVKEKRKSGFIPINLNTQADFNSISIDGINKMYCLYEDFFESFLSNIHYIQEEFIFIEWVVSLSDMLDIRKTEITYPTKGKLDIEYGIDIHLLLKHITTGYSKSVYGNDFVIENNESVIVVGSNNSGKTVLLKTLGISSVFFQLGLFIAARKATLPIKKSIHTIFSGEEVDSDVGGRFEKEVLEIKDIIDSVDCDSFVIINEIFQSTFANDGMKCLFDILDYFLNLDVSFLTVTHLLDITKYKDKFSSKVSLYHTTNEENKYKVIKGD